MCYILRMLNNSEAKMGLSRKSINNIVSSASLKQRVYTVVFAVFSAIFALVVAYIASTGTQSNTLCVISLISFSVALLFYILRTLSRQGKRAVFVDFVIDFFTS